MKAIPHGFLKSDDREEKEAPDESSPERVGNTADLRDIDITCEDEGDWSQGIGHGNGNGNGIGIGS